MKLVVIGAGGRLGRAFVRLLGGRHEVWRVTRAELDLADEEAVHAFAEVLDADWVVNCAAISGLEACLDDLLTAHQVNARAPEILASACHRKGIAFLHVSTDYVMDGRHAGLKDESVACKPVNHYGQSKLEGELRVRELAPGAWIGRISWIFCEDVPSFPHQVLARAFSGERLEAIGDKFSLPTFADDFVLAWERLALAGIEGGVYHFCNAGEPVSWADYGAEVLRLAGELGAPLKNSRMHPTRLADAHFFREPRPAHTAMACGRIESALGAPIRPWQEAMHEHLQQLADPGWRVL